MKCGGYNAKDDLGSTGPEAKLLYAPGMVGAQFAEDDSAPADKEFIDEYFPGANCLVCCQGQEYDPDHTIRIVFADENGEPRTTPGFEDVTPTAYYAAPVAYAVVKNITNGTSAATFSPGQNCTQAQIWTFLYRAYKR